MKFKTSALLSHRCAKVSRRFLSSALLAAAAPLASAWLISSDVAAANDVVRLTFSAELTFSDGRTVNSVDIRLFPDAAPITVENFLRYVTEGRYNETFIHRSEKDFVVQGGGYTVVATEEGNSITPIDRYDAITNEFNQSNLQGTLAMARASGVEDSATSEWFVNIVDNDPLDGVDGGFTVFGELRTAADVEFFNALNSLSTFSVDGTGFTNIPTLDDQGSLVWIISAEVISRDETVNDRIHTWVGGTSGKWDLTTRNWNIVEGNGIARIFTQGSEVVFNTPVGTRNDIALVGGLNVADLCISGGGTLVFNGAEGSGGITGQVGGVVPSNAGALLKKDAGTAVFQSTVLDFPGGTRVSGGILALDNTLLRSNVRVDPGAVLLIGPNGSGTGIYGNIVNYGTIQTGNNVVGRLVINGTLTNEGVLLLKLFADGSRDIIRNDTAQPIVIGGTLKLDIASEFFTGNSAISFNFGEFVEAGAGDVSLSPDTTLAFANPLFIGEITDWASGQIELRRSIEGIPVRSHLIRFRSALNALHANDPTGASGSFVESILSTASGAGGTGATTQAIAVASPLGYSSLTTMSNALANSNVAAVRGRIAAFYNGTLTENAPAKKTDATSAGIRHPYSSNLYIAAGGSLAKNGTENTNPFYDTQTYSVGVGIDGHVKDKILAGVRLDGGSGNADFHFDAGKATTNQFQATGYASIPLTNQFRADTAVFAAYANHEVKHRTLAGGAVNEADARGITAGVSSWLTGSFTITETLDFSPFAGVEFTHASTGSLTEDGGEANGALSIDAISQNSLRVRVGGAVRWRFLPDAHLSLNLAYARELLGTDTEIKARFTAAGLPKFRVNAPALAENAIEAGPSLDVKLSDATAISAGYFFESNFADRTAHHFNASFQWRF
ncbi:MAG: autotransporter domain-containing protein [Puniceicoccales bacterium]|jgi:cyclophilin family peptidyl-prolyl cis-trans isomerase|nr:autotransporter domain-containing protein [Puniceicoccales bacterium]